MLRDPAVREGKHTARPLPAHPLGAPDMIVVLNGGYEGRCVGMRGGRAVEEGFVRMKQESKNKETSEGPVSPGAFT